MGRGDKMGTDEELKTCNGGRKGHHISMITCCTSCGMSTI